MIVEIEKLSKTTRKHISKNLKKLDTIHTHTYTRFIKQTIPVQIHKGIFNMNVEIFVCLKADCRVVMSIVERNESKKKKEKK